MPNSIQDLVCVHIENNPAFYARIEDISPDVKPGWWQVKLLVLTHPLQVFTWILDESQINGASFTMGGTPVMLERVVPPENHDGHAHQESVEGANECGEKKKERGKVVSIVDRKKNL
ncbi:MAG: hypothetical protein VB050_14965 [Geobacteraceae bacterium]|nr:hypothetical protein [Geobacteraceae bacterium]